MMGQSGLPVSSEPYCEVLRCGSWDCGRKCLNAWTPGTEVRAPQAGEKDDNVQRRWGMQSMRSVRSAHAVESGCQKL